MSFTSEFLCPHTGGFMESLDNYWILQGNVQQCEQFEKTPNTLGLKNMAGVFILVGAGIIGGIMLIIIEMAYKKHQIRKQKKIELARHAADKWRGTVEMRKTMRSSDPRPIHSNGITDAGTVSLKVDTVQKTSKINRSPGRAWPGDSDLRQICDYYENQTQIPTDSKYYVEASNLFV